MPQTCWLNQLSITARVSNNSLHFDFCMKHFSCGPVNYAQYWKPCVLFKFVWTAKNSQTPLMEILINELSLIENIWLILWSFTQKYINRLSRKLVYTPTNSKTAPAVHPNHDRR